MKSELPKKIEINEALRHTLEQVVRTVAEKPKLEVTSGLDHMTRLSLLRSGKNPDETWFHSPEQLDPMNGKQRAEFVHIPETIAEYGEIPALGKAAHEGAHVVSTRLENMDPDWFPNEIGFSAVLHALEERPTDQLVRERYPAAGEWLNTARLDSYLEGMESEKKKAALPKFAQLCELLVYYPTADDLQSYDSEVVELYEKMRPDIEFVENCIPPSGSTEEQIVKQQTLRLQILKLKIWPRVKQLVQEDQQEEMIMELIKAILAGNIEIGTGEPGGKPEVRISLPADLAEQLAKLGKPSKAAPEDLPTIKASPELIEALRKALENLPQEIKDQLSEQADKNLEKIEQQIVDEHAGKMVERPKTALERRQEMEENLRRHQEEEARGASENRRREIAAEQGKVQRLQAALLEQKTVYDNVYEEVRDTEQDLYEDLKPIFQPQIKTKPKIKSAGSKINLGAFMKWDMARLSGKYKETKFFEYTEKPHRNSYAIKLLIDLSGSMSGDQKIEQAFRAVVILAEALNRLGIDLEIDGFQDEIIEFKKGQQKLDDNIRRKISGMLDEVAGKNLGGHNGPSYNDDGPCVLEAAESLAAKPAINRFLVVISDGLPAGRRSNTQDLIDAVSKINRAGKITLIGLGLGQGTEHVSRYYPVSLPNIQANQLTEVLPELFKDILKNPGKYKMKL